MASFENRRSDVAVFIDFENVYVSVRDKFDINPNFELIMDRCNELGRVVLARAYADWYRYPRITSSLYANAIEPIYVPTYYYDKDAGRTGRAIKNSVDMNMCIDAMKTLFTQSNIARFVLATGDRDFIPLVNTIRQLGKEVIIIGIGGAASTHLAQSADEFIFYEQLMKNTPVRSLPILEPAFVPEQPMAMIVPDEPVPVSTAIRGRSGYGGRNARNGSSRREAPPRQAEPVAARAPEPIAARVHEPVAVRAAEPAPRTEPAHKKSEAASQDIYEVLMKAVHLVRQRGYVSTLGSLKLVMKELMDGDFRENRYKDLSGRFFTKFKDFVLDAEKRGKVQLFTNGSITEIFLPGEDPSLLSQFNAETREEPDFAPPGEALVVAVSEPEESSETGDADDARNGNRRRRRRRRSRRDGSYAAESGNDVADLDEADEPVAPSAFTGTVPSLEDLSFSDGIQSLDELTPFEDIEPVQIASTDPQYEAIDLAEPEPAAAAPAKGRGRKKKVTPAVAAAPAPEQKVPEQPAARGRGRKKKEETAEAPVATASAPAAKPGARGAAAKASNPAAKAPQPTFVAPPVVEEEDEQSSMPLEPVAFSTSEWDVFTAMMQSFSRPVSFAQICDALQDLRKQETIQRSNEQLRTMAKQAINNGMLERSGKGKKIVYTLRQES